MLLIVFDFAPAAVEMDGACDVLCYAPSCGRACYSRSARGTLTLTTKADRTRTGSVGMEPRSSEEIAPFGGVVFLPAVGSLTFETA